MAVCCIIVITSNKSHKKAVLDGTDGNENKLKKKT